MHSLVAAQKSPGLSAMIMSFFPSFLKQNYLKNGSGVFSQHPHFHSVGGRNRPYFNRSYLFNAEMKERRTYGLFI